VRQGGYLYRIDDYCTYHYLVFLFGYEVSGSGGPLSFHDHGDERHSYISLSSYGDLFQAKVHH